MRLTPNAAVMAVDTEAVMAGAAGMLAAAPMAAAEMPT
jgi:hypothetical protein